MSATDKKLIGSVLAFTMAPANRKKPPPPFYALENDDGDDDDDAEEEVVTIGGGGSAEEVTSVLTSIWDAEAVTKLPDGRWKCGHCGHFFKCHNATKALAHVSKTPGKDIAVCSLLWSH
jgi:hypothetical protein